MEVGLKEVQKLFIILSLSNNAFMSLFNSRWQSFALLDENVARRTGDPPSGREQVLKRLESTIERISSTNCIRLLTPSRKTPSTGK